MSLIERILHADENSVRHLLRQILNAYSSDVSVNQEVDMQNSAFHGRASALENAFFRRVDQELILRLQEQHQHELFGHALTEATGITDSDLLDELIAAEITPKTLVALSLFPAVYVAWADGRVDVMEQDAVLRAAAKLGVTRSSPAWDLIGEWMKTRPTEEMWTVWSDFIHAIQSTIKVTAFRELREAAMVRAKKIAEVAGGFLGFKTISQAERDALQRLEAVWQDAAKQGLKAGQVV